METLIRRRVLRRLIWVCTVCRLPFYGYPDYIGLRNAWKNLKVANRSKQLSNRVLLQLSSPSKKALKHSAKKAKKITEPSKSDMLYSPQPGPSHINLVSSSSELESEEEFESQIPDKDKCCVCKRFYAQSREAL